MNEVPAERASPKSRILRVQSDRTTMLLGFRSLIKVNIFDILHIGGGGAPVDDAGEVEVLDAAQHLVEEIGHALMVQVHVDHLAQVRVHELHHDVEVKEVLQRLLGRERVQKANNLRVQNTMV